MSGRQDVDVREAIGQAGRTLPPVSRPARGLRPMCTSNSLLPTRPAGALGIDSSGGERGSCGLSGEDGNDGGQGRLQEARTDSRVSELLDQRKDRATEVPAARLGQGHHRSHLGRVDLRRDAVGGVAQISDHCGRLSRLFVRICPMNGSRSGL